MSARADLLLVRTTPAVLGYGAAVAVVLGAFNYTGGRLTGYNKDPEIDEVARKEYLRKNRRRPMEDTVQDLGEGRGMYLSFVRPLESCSVLTDNLRHLRSWLRREKGREAEGCLRLRCPHHTTTRCSIDNLAPVGIPHTRPFLISHHKQRANLSIHCSVADNSALLWQPLFSSSPWKTMNHQGSIYKLSSIAYYQREGASRAMLPT